MFTGIIETVGTVMEIRSQGEGRVLSVASDLDLSSVRVGDSIAVNGACLTAVTLQKGLFQVDMAPETVSRTTFERVARGAVVNIERALRLSDRLDGHLVSGHVDGVGTITGKRRMSNAFIITIAVPESLAGEMIEKGSVAVDGISLTINRCSGSDFEVSVIPHTADITTMGRKNVGDRVNIETDMIGKYVRKFLTSNKGTNKGDRQGSTDISMGFLAEKGFI